MLNISLISKNHNRSSGGQKTSEICPDTFPLDTPYNYKIILALLKYMIDNDHFKELGNGVDIVNVTRDNIKPLANGLQNFFVIYYKTFTRELVYLTADGVKYKNKINKIKRDKQKILYFNDKAKGREFTDTELLEIDDIKNKVKNISYTDIGFDKVDDIYHTYYDIKFNDKKLDTSIKKHKLINRPFFVLEYDYDKVYFGHLRNRYHNKGISKEIRGIGLGYKIYKAFLKFNGYMISDQQTSPSAQKIYYHLMKDDDVYCIVEKIGKSDTFAEDSNKVLLIWKHYPKLNKLLKIIRTHELRNKRKYEYDRELLSIVKQIKIDK